MQTKFARVSSIIKFINQSNIESTVIKNKVWCRCESDIHDLTRFFTYSMPYIGTLQEGGTPEQCYDLCKKNIECTEMESVRKGNISGTYDTA